MFIDKSYTLKVDSNKRVFQSDNYSSYISFSDMEYEFDGLWSHGFKLFNGVTINGAILNGKKELNPFGFEIYYTKGLSLNGMLFKNNQGLLLDTGKNAFRTEYVNRKRHNSVSYQFSISSKFTILELKNNTLYVQYMKPERDGFEVEHLFVAFTTTKDFTIRKNDSNENTLIISIDKKIRTKESPYLYILYSHSLDQLKTTVECNQEKHGVLIQQHINNSLLPLKYTGCKTGNKKMNRALTYSLLSASSFIMNKNGQIGIWAGFPWFDNGWGRDTFIALPGVALVTGRYEIASHIIGNFLKYQNQDKCSKDYGKIPNVIFSEDNIKYNTGDGTPLLIRELYEYFLYTGDVAAVMSVWNNVITAIDEVYFVNKDVNYFMPSGDADDWMDARILGKNSYSPRGDRQVEIQSLWFTALHAVANIASEIIKRYEEYKPIVQNININELKEKKDQYTNAANKLQASFKQFFITDKTPFIFDHINKDNTPDYKIRPNVMLASYYNDLIGIPKLIDDNSLLHAFKIIVNNCVFEHGVASLSKFDEDFHPLHITKTHHKDAAYHNGAIWGWLSGAFIHCATKFGLQNFAFKHTNFLIDQLLFGETVGTLSELFEPYKEGGLVKESGTFSQAWSVSEFTRSFYQDYLGIRPDVPQRKLHISPSFPGKLGDFSANIRYGISEIITVDIKINKHKSIISLIEVKAVDIEKPLEVIIRLNLGPEKDGCCKDYKVIFLKIQLKTTGAQVKIDFDFIEKNRLRLRDLFISNNSELITMGTDTIGYCENASENVDFVKPITEDDLLMYKSYNEENYLDKKILGEDFDIIERFKN
ncbi:MAG: hypothetical protein A2015_12160 [Spirochaetes bacterium GWF1_31_7]|nr:MAG: hypothetical protein A2Y30_14915 [Spirochaetes bacterium GWE1_32_154]OHD49170.1 MAG: hypothetical protein A2015_12160 [Spirochaetes bacterium GWF1_31_7]OHD50245.1 MAG: hypothetical protein A2Y29_12965 [Spirochaetes bacterium GWE2_31_10]OHD76614.1 MAG: hypothetical protein A2355_13590 [Spirochaetes bacterium RIFOXYB1_FULL_32_8]